MELYGIVECVKDLGRKEKVVLTVSSDSTFPYLIACQTDILTVQ